MIITVDKLETASDQELVNLTYIIFTNNNIRKSWIKETLKNCSAPSRSKLYSALREPYFWNRDHNILHADGTPHYELTDEQHAERRKRLEQFASDRYRVVRLIELFAHEVKTNIFGVAVSMGLGGESTVTFTLEGTQTN